MKGWKTITFWNLFDFFGLIKKYSPYNQSGRICMVKCIMPSKIFPKEQSKPCADWTIWPLGRPYGQPANQCQGTGCSPWQVHKTGSWRAPTQRPGAANSRPGDTGLEIIQGRLAWLGGYEADLQKLGGRHHEDISNSNDVHSEILEEKLIPLLLRLIGPDRLQVNENSKKMRTAKPWR